MKALINQSEIKGKAIAPSSKSYTIRGLMCAAMARGESQILNPLSSDDTEVAVDVLRHIGVHVHQGEGYWRVEGRQFRRLDTELYCGESAATLRFMTAICSLVPGRCRLVSKPSLASRPISTLIEALKQLGVDCFYLKEEATVVVNGGKLKGGTTTLPGNISSQFVSALLLISPLAEEGMRIKLTTPLESQSFVLMTLECLRKFGIRVNFSEDLREFEAAKQAYQPAEYQVEGDWSSASYLLALGALCGEVAVENLNPASLQGDRIILDLLKNMGAKVIANGNSITVKKSRLNSIKADLSDGIDLLPTVAVLTAAADGVSRLTGIERARLKESDRISAVREGLERMGIKVAEEKNSLTITGSELKGAVIDSKGDHRIAMAFSLLGSVTGGTIIEDAECVSKTYPDYWDTLKSLGGEVRIDGQ